MRPRGAALLLLLLAGGPLPARAEDPSRQWRTIETPHFLVHYYRSERHNERDVAQKVARAAEKAHARLTPLLRHTPSGPTQIVVTDDTDGANGSAQIVPMNIIRLYATGPSSMSELNDYDDWIYGLFLHEYTHILHIDTIHGLARLINAILGKTWAPNQVQPRWFTEGLAVYYESSRSSAGRNRNTIYDMYLRMAVLEGKLLELDQMSSLTRHFPRGNVPYLYGSRFLEYLARRFGEDKLVEISHIYGGGVIPYAMNRTAKKALGRTFDELYGDFKEYLRRRYVLQQQAVQRAGPTPFRKVTDYGEACGSPRYSSDGRELVFIDTDGRSQFAVKVLDLATRKITEKFDIFGGSGVEFTPDGREIIYGASSVYRTFQSYHDLFVRNRKSGHVRRLTRGLRARDPSVSPDGQQVAFVTNELGTMGLSVIPFDGGAPRVLLAGEPGDQLYMPRWSPDGRTLVYSRMSGARRDIQLLDLATGRTKDLTSDRAMDIDPVFSPDGKRVYFSSDRGGIYNLYCHDLQTGELLQVSNLLGGAFTPAVSPDEREAHFVGFSAVGFDLYAMSLDRARYTPAPPYVDARPPPVQVPAGPEYPEKPYNPLYTLYPRSWTLAVGADAYGTTLGIELGGADVAGHHSYLAALNFSTKHGHPSYNVIYGYNRLWPSIRLDTSRFEGPRGGLTIDGKKLTYIEENYGAGLGVGLPLLRTPNHAGDVSLGYRFNWFRDADQTKVLVGPDHLSPQLPRVGILSGLTVGISYQSLESYARSISTESGRAISVGLRLDHPVFGSDYQSTTVSYAWTEYVDLPWADDHVLALRLAGGVSSGDLSRRGVFYIGGFPEQDVLRTLFDVARPGGAYLRGYAPWSVYGDQFHLFNLEYRLPVLEIQKGFSSLPLYFSHMHLAAFVDVGNAFFDQFDPEDLKVGVGAEVLVEVIIGYVVPSTFRIGYARGLMDPGGDEFHFLLGRPF